MSVITRIREAGRMLSAKNEQHIRDAHGSLSTVLDAMPAPAAEATASEALREAERSWGQVQAMVGDAVCDAYVKPGMERWDVYVTDMFDSYAIVRVDGALWSVPWAIANNVVTLGEPTEVIQTYAAADDGEPAGAGDGDGDDGVLAPAGIPATEAATPTRTATLLVEAEAVPLLEGAVRDDNTATIKVIQPGWGSSGFYSAAMLERDGSKAFPAGTHMYVDHPSVSEAADRPERSVRELAGALTTDAWWDASGPAGAGLYAEAEVLAPFRDVLEEIAPHIGVSIRASGFVSEGEVDGRRGPVVESLESGESIDYVTRAGAGGQVLTLMESARATRAARGSVGSQPLEADMSEQELREAQGQITQLQAQLAQLGARETASLALRAAGLPEVAQTRVLERVLPALPLAEGVLDAPAFATRVEEAIAAERAYLAALAPGGQILGMGGPTPDLSEADAQQALVGAFGRLGLTEAAAGIAARGR